MPVLAELRWLWKASRFCEALHDDLRGRLPAGSLSGGLAKREPELQQEALILLYDRYLPSRPTLQAATTLGDARRVSEEIRYATIAAIQAVIKTAWAKARRNREDAYPPEKLFIFCDRNQPTISDHLNEESRLALALAALRSLAERAGTQQSGAKVALSILEEGKSMSEVAREQGVSRQAIHAKLQRLRGPITEVIAGLEASHE